jgi:uncharacterized membrane protein
MFFPKSCQWFFSGDGHRHTLRRNAPKSPGNVTSRWFETLSRALRNPLFCSLMSDCVFRGILCFFCWIFTNLVAYWRLI